MDTSPLGKPSVFAQSLAWIGAVSGIALIVYSLVAAEGLWGRLGGILVGLAFIGPAAWWFYCAQQDKKKAAQHEEILRSHRELTALLGPDTPELVRGMGSVETPQPTDRRWPVVSAGAAVALIAGAVMMPAGDQPTNDVYRDCTDVWNELERPLEEGEPGYVRNLDADTDGVACEIDPR
ncbi:excalibur calcium-binding domain-containing protein [Corynebacterium breve]|uniref:Excalibur calcium-binding domain-containing protein n=1 Tax=Corynebacterium breve TaxID=3049799 RepID=A0ABY8VHM8_9CORY|nr:excalibur calcium-binding domain-containing protein [Corynebacterium breve]WIM67055.1 excalibur calcium-binding domain-containing protein [Corynebacterium breve]